MPLYKGVFLLIFRRTTLIVQCYIGRDIMSKCFKFIMKIARPSLYTLDVQHNIFIYNVGGVCTLIYKFMVVVIKYCF